jgi:hypothetical protein
MAGRLLEDSRTLKYYNIEQYSTIDLAFALKGGASVGFTFNDMTKVVIRAFTSSAPAYR